MRSPEVNQPIVFADQKLKKIFVMNSDRTGTVLPENLQLTDKQGNILCEGYLIVISVLLYSRF